MNRVLLVAWLVWSALVSSSRAECFLDTFVRDAVITDEFALLVSSGSGAVGDVVGVTVAARFELSSPGWADLQLTLCHDPQISEFVGTPAYTDEFLSLLGPLGVDSFPVDEDDDGAVGNAGHGLIVNAQLDREAYERRFPSPEFTALFTVYYRLRGSPGARGAVRLCDAELSRENSWCNYNRLHAYHAANPRGSNYLPGSVTDGTLTVRPGPATQAERPPEPPAAAIYPAMPSDDEVNFGVRVTGASAPPGATEVPVDVYSIAAVEYTGVMIPLRFDARYLRVSRVDSHVTGGLSLVAPGSVLVFTGLGINARRLAAAGEEVHVATLYLDVLAAAQAISATRLEVRPVTINGIEHTAWIGVRHAGGGLATGDAVVTSEVSPVELREGAFAIGLASAEFIRGDANVDGEVNISDPVAILNSLFLGSGKLRCLDAADSTDDATLDMSDAIHLLNFLFLGPMTFLPDPHPTCGFDPPTDPSLGCEDYPRTSCSQAAPEKR